MMEKPTKKTTTDLDVQLTFLKETKDGKYAEIEKSSLPYVRISEDAQFIDTNQEEYYYSMT